MVVCGSLAGYEKPIVWVKLTMWFVKPRKSVGPVTSPRYEAKRIMLIVISIKENSFNGASDTTLL